MSNVVIVDAVRTPIGKRNGGLSTLHPAQVLATVQQAIVERTGIDPSVIDQVIGGCVSQVGEQAFNITRTAWLSAGLPITTAATTVDTQCGSSQQATNLATALVGSGVVDVALACGVEVMSRIPIGVGGSKALGLGIPIPKTYFDQYEMTSQFEGAERIAEKYGITRADTDAFGFASQQRAAQAWAEDRFSGQYVTVDAPDRNDDGSLADTFHTVARDEGLRETTMEKLASLKPVGRENGVHTAGNSSQISDGASAVLLMTQEKADALGLKARARIVDTCNVGVDPVLMLTGPIDATQRLLARTGLSIDDIDTFEINEAFASVVLAWQKAVGADPAKTNPNGGAIALGHPLGGTGGFLITKALYELERIGGRYGLISMCCGGGLGTGTIIERL
ncbi:MAG: steroid 3-ketoacyl-CoA thiolase [Ilumatobacteraceae bacterium]|jgi:acetyl-CoA C-acetyltransferase|nr:steroid 3-ketoacyl-CoA thiolase [Ilumatobacteraceae bacterium]MBP7889794.1 steroid 3-ketoacyl-CoA thiolase [Ilumatobacteraceae bacterium]MBP8211039.1 steroid 3-ketoacyl-CoA thiolase [Ilumatobacteraceae bacterium]MBP9052332.1 steroid 3-ketoacyl-CoA thiolase [Ilumatobacteraceae bacterium]HQY84910.1 steroid 3-ketoacyl-CoA thiolase [Ilumatobacteraceae bacterium]